VTEPLVALLSNNDKAIKAAAIGAMVAIADKTGLAMHIALVRNLQCEHIFECNNYHRSHDRRQDRPRQAQVRMFFVYKSCL
jgi:hypothetical protein